MQIYITKHGQQNGPYSVDDLNGMLESETITGEDLCWYEGCENWLPLAKFPGFAPPPHSPLPPNPGVNATATPPPSKKTSSKTFSESLIEKATITARLAQKQAHKRKLEMVDLKDADYQTGRRAYEAERAPEQFPEIRSQITEVRDQIDALRNTTGTVYVSLSEKAKAAANATVRTVKVETLTLKQKRLLADLGARLRENSADDPSLAAEIANAREKVETIRGLDSEIKSLSSQTFTWARRPLLVFAIFTSVVVVSIGYSWFSDTTPNTNVTTGETGAGDGSGSVEVMFVKTARGSFDDWTNVTSQVTNASGQKITFLLLLIRAIDAGGVALGQTNARVENLDPGRAVRITTSLSGVEFGRIATVEASIINAFVASPGHPDKSFSIPLKIVAFNEASGSVTSIDALKKVAPGVWTGRQADICLRLVVKTDGTYDSFAVPITADGWGAPERGTWESISEKYNDTGKRYYGLRLSGGGSAIIENSTEMRFPNLEMNLTKGDTFPFTK